MGGMAGKESWDGERGMEQERSGRRREARGEDEIF